MKIGFVSLKNKLLEKEVFHKNVSNVIKALRFPDLEIICDASPQAIYVLHIFMETGLKNSTIHFPCGYSPSTGINSCWREPSLSGHFHGNSNAEELRSIYRRFERKIELDKGHIEDLISSCISLGSKYKEVWSGDTLGSITSIQENLDMLIML